MPFFFLIIRPPPTSTLSLHGALPICGETSATLIEIRLASADRRVIVGESPPRPDRKRKRLNTTQQLISYAVFFFNNTATPDIYTFPTRRSSDLWRGVCDSD